MFEERKMLRQRGRLVPYPFSLYKESATGARWLCAFLKHQLPEWSCREAMHCGTGVSDFVTIFDCLFTVHGIVVCISPVQFLW